MTKTVKTAKTVKTSVNAKVDEKAYIAYMEKDLARFDVKNNAKLMMRAAAKGTEYSDWRAKRMNDAPEKMIPRNGVGYCVQVYNNKLQKKYVISCLTTLAKFKRTNPSNKDLTLTVVPIKFNLNRYRGYTYVLFDTEEEATAYKNKLIYEIDHKIFPEYEAWKW